MPILDEPSLESFDGNWVRTILQEKERQLNNNNGCDLHQKCISTQKLKGMIECPTCHSTPARKVIIQQCNNGHIMCQKCRHPNQATCPYLHCQAPLNLPSSIRNLFCEKIMNLLPLECSFMEHGCKASEIKDTEQLLLHEKRCPHRLVRCIYPLCQSIVPINKLPNHILDASHSITSIAPCSEVIEKCTIKGHITRIGTFMDSRICWKVLHIYVDGRFSLERKHFFTELIQIAPGSDSDWLFWIYMLGSEKEASEYEYTSAFESSSELSLSHKIDGKCVSVDKRVETILNDASSQSSIASKSSTIISSQVISNFINPSDGSLKISIDIKKSSHKLPLAISIPDVINSNNYSNSENLSNGINHLNEITQADEYAFRMLQNMSQTYKQIDKICSISGHATGFEKGPYSRSKQTQNKIFKLQKEKSKLS